MKSNEKREPVVLTVEEAAFRLGVTKTHIVNLIDEGKIYALDVAIGFRHHWRIPVTALERFKKERTEH